MQFGSDSYRAGAMERIEEARTLLERDHLVASLYFAGLAVEGMLRSLVWLRDKRFDERHDLRSIATRIESLGLLRSGGRDVDFVAMVQSVGTVWTNDLRFADTDSVTKRLLRSRTLKSKDAGAMRQLCRQHYDRALQVMGRCEILWRRQR